MRVKTRTLLKMMALRQVFAIVSRPHINEDLELAHSALFDVCFENFHIGEDTTYVMYGGSDLKKCLRYFLSEISAPDDPFTRRGVEMFRSMVEVDYKLGRLAIRLGRIVPEKPKAPRPDDANNGPS